MNGMNGMEGVRLLLIGFGYSAATIGRIALDSGATVVGTVQQPERAAALRAAGFDARVFNTGIVGNDVRTALIEATHVVVSVPPGETAEDPVLATLGNEIFAPPSPVWVGYLSTVGVYGDHDGAWVDEASETRAVRRRSVARLAAERSWAEHAGAAGVPLAILRLSGIYGPGRNALATLSRGHALRTIKPGQVFNRVHVEDVAMVTHAAAARRAGGIFNVADDEPAPPQDVVTYAASLMGVEPPPEKLLDEANLSPMSRSFYEDNRRVSNARIKTEFGLTLRYPTYRVGLGSMWRDGTWGG